MVDDMKLREALRPLVRSLTPESALRVQRLVEEGFRDDGLIDLELIAGVLPAQRLDMVIAPSTPAGVHAARFFIPEASRVTRIAMLASGGVSGTIRADVLVNGVARTSAAIRSGMDRSTGVVSLDLPAGSVVAIQTHGTVAQGVTISLFYRPSEG